MKRAFLLIVVPALLVVLGFAQTPAASINTDQTNIKGCLKGSDGNYTVAEDNTGHIFKITTSTVDLKPHLGHDVTLVGQRPSGGSSAADGNSIVVSEVNMISEHCAGAAAPAATVSTPSDTAVIAPAAAAVPAANASTSSETASTPAAAATTPPAAVTTPAETAVITPATPAASVTTPPAETPGAPAPATAAAPPASVTTPPAETASAPVAATAVAPAASVTTPPAETVSAPVAPTAPASPKHSRRLPAKPAATPTKPDAVASTSAEADNKAAVTPTTPDAAAGSSSDAASAPAAAATTPKAPAKKGSLWILISCAVLVIVVGTMVPLLTRWRKRKMLARTGPQNLSFTKEASPEPIPGEDKSAPPITRKAA